MKSSVQIHEVPNALRKVVLNALRNGARPLIEREKALLLFTGLFTANSKEFTHEPMWLPRIWASTAAWSLQMVDDLAAIDNGTASCGRKQ